LDSPSGVAQFGNLRPIVDLPRNLPVGGGGATGVPCLAPRAVAQFAPQRAIGFEDDTGGTKVVIQQIVQRCPIPHQFEIF